MKYDFILLCLTITSQGITTDKSVNCKGYKNVRRNFLSENEQTTENMKVIGISTTDVGDNEREST
jgi:hypothetical protein